jgi:hypothetical protein
MTGLKTKWLELKLRWLLLVNASQKSILTAKIDLLEHYLRTK